MKKDDLRKVKITNQPYSSANNSINGYFHTFGDFPMPLDNGSYVPRSLAIVELEDGKVEKFEVKQIRFVDSF
jgi:hypothetical protein